MKLKSFAAVVATSGLMAASLAAEAALIPIGIGAFSGTETVVDYGPTSTLVPVNGMTIGGVLHNFSIGGSASTDATVDSGPGNTNNITVANIEGNSAGILSLLFPHLETRMGFGWASSFPPGGGTIALFDALNVSLGTLSFSGAPDPIFFGGFAGVQSDVAFARAEISWVGGPPIGPPIGPPGSPPIGPPIGPTSRFAFDNLRFEGAVPEPATLALLGLGLAGLGFSRRRKA